MERRRRENATYVAQADARTEVSHQEWAVPAPAQIASQMPSRWTDLRCGPE